MNDDIEKFGAERERLNEIVETMGIALMVGGSIIIPHLRRAFDIWDDLKNK